MSKIIVTQLYPNIVEAMKDKNNKKIINDTFASYMNKNVSKLTTAGPLYRTTFMEAEKQPYYIIAKLSDPRIREVLKSISSIKSKNNILKEPFFTLIALYIKYSIDTKDDQFRSICQSILMLSMYPSLHFKYFKYEVNSDIMDYTINHLSNKFTIKQETTFYHALSAIMENAYKLHKNRLINGDDKYIVGYILDVKTRLNSVFKNLASEYYKNHKQGLYLGKEEDNFDPDNYKEYDSNIYQVNNITNKVVITLVTQGPNIKLVDISAKMNQVSVNSLRNYLNTLITGERRTEIQEIIEGLLYIFIVDGRNDIRYINSKDFILYTLDIYRTSNVNNKYIIRIKEILDSWMTEVGITGRSTGSTTLNNFRRALYTFFVYSIQYANQR